MVTLSERTRNAPAPRIPAVVRYLGQPILLGAVAAAIAGSIASGVRLDLASVAILIGMLAALTLLEQRYPHRASWSTTPRERRRDGVYLGLNGVVGALVNVGVGLLAIGLARRASGLPLAVEIPAGLALTTLAGYWVHRLGHRVEALWQLHGIHHAPSKVNAWNNNVIHFADLALQSAASLAPLVLLDFSAQSVFAVTAFGQAAGFLDHANVDFRLGPLNYVVGSPEQHRLHHSTDLEEAGHYSILPLWDLVFGTFTWRPGRAPRVVGLVDPATFPSPDSIAASLTHPLRAWWRAFAPGRSRLAAQCDAPSPPARCNMNARCSRSTGMPS